MRRGARRKADRVLSIRYWQHAMTCASLHFG
jgi:hypothetical protein